MKLIKVSIRFVEPIAAMMGMKKMTATIRSEKRKGLMDIKDIIRKEAGEQFLYSILVGGASIDLYEKDLFEEDEHFVIIPIVLGG